MKDTLEYKGYHARIVFNAESHTLRGVIEGINDYVDFESDSIQAIENEFHNAVDDYLLFCEQIKKSPEKEYKGSFNVRISPELHRRIAQKAFRNKTTLNAEVEKAISEYVSERTVSALGISTFSTNPMKEQMPDFRSYLAGVATKDSLGLIPPKDAAEEYSFFRYGR